MHEHKGNDDGRHNPRHAELAKRLGAAIASHRARASLSQEQLAEKLGIGVQAMSRIERGAVPPSVARLFDMADIFDCRVEEMLRDVSDRPADKASHIQSLFDSLPAEEQRAMVDAFGLIAKRFQARAEKAR
jgi:transcriptional regulator with XRE-family HTH domain